MGEADRALALSNEAIDGAVDRNAAFRGSFLIQRVKVKLELRMDPHPDMDELLLLLENDRQHAEYDALLERIKHEAVSNI